MGERGVRNAEVAGSSPAISTNFYSTTASESESDPVNDIAVILFLLIGMSMMGFAGAKGPTAGRPLIGFTGIICFAAGIVVAVA